MTMLEQRKRTNAIEMLEDDHRTIRQLFRMHQAADREARRLIASKIFGELEVHAMLEERIFYPILEVKSQIEARSLVEDARLDVLEIKELIKDLKRLGPEDREYDVKLKSLRLDVEHHMAMVEEELFPLAEQVFESHALNLGEAMLEMKQACSMATPL